MKKKLLVLIVVMITIINVFSIAILYFDYQGLDAPETIVKIEIIEMSPNNAIIQTTLEIYNPNGNELITKDFKLITKTPDGTVVIETEIGGGSIPSHEEVTFIKAIEVNFSGSSPETLETKITGTVGIKSGIIDKSLPISVKIITVLGDVVKNFVVPTANINIKFGEISQQKINISLGIEASNPNSFDLRLEDISIEMINETGGNVGEFLFNDVVLAANSKINLTCNGSIMIEALNAKFIEVNMSAKAAVKIAGFEQSLPIYVNANIKVPDLKDIMSSKVSTDAILKSDFRFTLRGLTIYIDLRVKNPNKVDIVGKDITFSIYRLDRATKALLGDCSLGAGVIEAEDVTVFSGELIIPYRKLFIPPAGGRIIPDYLEIDVKANLTIKGLNSYFWVGVIAYQDLHPFRIDKWEL